MPEISRFDGIVIAMFHNDHDPAHFHARFGEYKIRVTIETLVVTGWFPPPQEALVQRWTRGNRAALLENWRRLRAHVAPLRIKPLE